MIRLDTHVVVWLYAGDVDRLGQAAREALESDVLVISPMVEFELTFLHEIGRLTITAADVVADLRERLGLTTSNVTLPAVVAAAATLSWTRDPFDRMIAADAVAANSALLTRDQTIHANLSLARW